MKAQGKITLDWANIFDILSIHNVKINLCENGKRIESEYNFSMLASEIKEQIGDNLYSEIIGSPFYKDLYELNRQIFVLIDDVKRNPLLGEAIDLRNYQRYIAKVALQKHFFATGLYEIKSGYEEN